MAAHRYWRIYVTAVSGGGTNYVAIASLELRVAKDGSGTDLGTSYSNTNQSTNQGASYVASKMFDNDAATRWDSAAVTAMPQWGSIDFGFGNDKDINSIVLKNTASEPVANHVSAAMLQYSDDDTNWTDWIRVAGHPNTASASVAYSRTLFAANMPLPTTVLNTGLKVDAALPMLVAGPYLTFAPVLPMPAVEVRLGNIASAALPMPSVYLAIVRGISNLYEFSMPMMTADIRSGAEVRSTFSMPTVAFTGTTTILCEIEAVMPMPTVSAHITKTESFRVAVTMPSPTSYAFGGGIASAALGMPTVEFVGHTGSVLSFDVTMPKPVAAMTVTAQAYSIIEAAMPMMVPGPYGRIVAMMPMPQASMEGRTVIAVTYEAYAVNLQPSAGFRESSVHEVTTYSNWEFDRVIRWRGSYYGVKSDGMYLLGGDTDAGAVIPWTMHTGLSNLGSRQMKACREAHVHGRVGLGLTAQASIGEAADKSYEAIVQAGENAQATRAKFGRGLKAVYWSFGLADPDGGPADIDALQLDAAELTRKVF